MKRLAILGCGGHGVVVAEAAIASGNWDEVFFLDDGHSSEQVLDFKVAGKLRALDNVLDSDTDVIAGIGDNKQRIRLLRQLADRNIQAITVIHPTAVVSPSATIGYGSVVLAGAILNARSTIGAGCIVNTSATVDHDCVVADAVHLSPGSHLAGRVTVGTESWIGVGASIRDGVTIGSHVTVGTGSAVVKNISDDLTVGGVPARALNS